MVREQYWAKGNGSFNMATSQALPHLAVHTNCIKNPLKWTIGCVSWDLCRVNLVDWTSRSSLAHSRHPWKCMKSFRSILFCSKGLLKKLPPFVISSPFFSCPICEAHGSRGTAQRCRTSVPWRQQSPDRTSGRPQMPWATVSPQLKEKLGLAMGQN